MTDAHCTEVAEELCNLLLEIVGRNTGRMQTARRHARVLDAATPHMNVTQRAEARRRIGQLETKWGPLLAGSSETYGHAAENCEISPETRVARWLSTRKFPERLLPVLYKAATAIWEGETSLYGAMGRAYARETDRVVQTVGYNSFSEWLVELRIAVRIDRGVYRRGALCQWWVDEMGPGKRTQAPYTACLMQALAIKMNR